MERLNDKKLALTAIGLLASATIWAQTADVDSTRHSQLEETQQLSEVVVKSSLPKTKVKGDAMRTIVNGTILEKAGSCTDVLNRIPQLKAEKDGAVEVFGRGNAEVYINGRKVQDLKELSRIQSDQIRMVDVVQRSNRAKDGVLSKRQVLVITMLLPQATTST